MQELATITSKRQLTIPADIFRRLNMGEREKVFVSEENGVIKIVPALQLLDRLAGSVKIPKRFKGLTSSEMVRKAKEEYFKKKYQKYGIH